MDVRELAADDHRVGTSRQPWSDCESSCTGPRCSARLFHHPFQRERLGHELVEQFVAGGLVELDVGYAAGDVGRFAWSRWEYQGELRCTLPTGGTVVGWSCVVSAARHDQGAGKGEGSKGARAALPGHGWSCRAMNVSTARAASPGPTGLPRRTCRSMIGPVNSSTSRSTSP